MRDLTYDCNDATYGRHRNGCKIGSSHMMTSLTNELLSDQDSGPNCHHRLRITCSEWCKLNLISFLPPSLAQPHLVICLYFAHNYYIFPEHEIILFALKEATRSIGTQKEFQSK